MPLNTEQVFFSFFTFPPQSNAFPGGEIYEIEVKWPITDQAALRLRFFSTQTATMGKSQSHVQRSWRKARRGWTAALHASRTCERRPFFTSRRQVALWMKKVSFHHPFFFLSFFMSGMSCVASKQLERKSYLKRKKPIIKMKQATYRDQKSKTRSLRHRLGYRGSCVYNSSSWL